MKRTQIFPVLLLGLQLISRLSALNCRELKWRKNVVHIFEVRKQFAMECGVEHSPDETYRWYKDGKPLVTNENIEYRDTSLQLLHFSESDEGLYTCYVLTPHSNGLYDTTLSRTISLRHPRIERFISYEPKYYDVVEYTYVRLECANKGLIIGDDIAYNWYTERVIQIRHESDRMYHDLTGALHITPVLKRDAGENSKPTKYWCGVSSQKLALERYGNDVYLRVKKVENPQSSKPVLKHKSINVKAPLNKIAVLECVFSGYHPSVGISYRWYLKDGTLIQTDFGKYRLSFHNRRLEILRVELSDGGVYYCQAENGAGVSTREQITVEVTCN